MYVKHGPSVNYLTLLLYMRKLAESTGVVAGWLVVAGYLWPVADINRASFC